MYKECSQLITQKLMRWQNIWIRMLDFTFVCSLTTVKTTEQICFSWLSSLWIIMTQSSQRWAFSSYLINITWSSCSYLKNWDLYDLWRVQCKKQIKLFKRWRKSQSEHRWSWLLLNRCRKRWLIEKDNSHITSRKKTRSD